MGILPGETGRVVFVVPHYPVVFSVEILKMLPRKLLGGMHDHLSIYADHAAYRRGDEAHVVRNQEDSHGFVQLPENVKNLLSRIGVYVGGRFVEKKEFRIAAKGPGDENPLLLASRKSPERAAFQVVKPYLLQGFSSGFVILFGISPPGFVTKPSRKNHFQHRYGKGAIEKGVLGGIPHPITAFLGRCTEKGYPSLSGYEQSQGKLEKGGFAPSVGAHDTGELPGRNGEIHIFENPSIFIAEGNVMKLQNRSIFQNGVHEVPFILLWIPGALVRFVEGLPWFGNRRYSPRGRGRRRVPGRRWRKPRYGLPFDRTGAE
jgi:hypothetical protein